jgi:DNA modification methylase
MCGDATDGNHAAALMSGVQADLVITDPPYNMNYVGAGGTRRKGIKNDKMPEHEFAALINSAFKNYALNMRDGAAGYSFYKETGGGVFLGALKSAELKFNQQCVWIKNQAVLGGSLYQGMHEPFLLFFKGDLKNKTWHGKRVQKSVIEDIDLMDKEQLIRHIKRVQSSDFGIIGDIVRADKPLKSDLHPTMKPIKLLAKLIENSSDKNNSVLDFFGGSGSTLIACEQTDRVCYMMELDPKYADVIIKRWEIFTDKKAVKLN